MVLQGQQKVQHQQLRGGYLQFILLRLSFTQSAKKSGRSVLDASVLHFQISFDKAINVKYGFFTDSHGRYHAV